MPGTLFVADAVTQTHLLIGILLAALLLTARPVASRALISKRTTLELKGIAILAVVFGHIGYFLVDNQRFLFPVSIGAGVGVDVFLFLSGYGLTLGMLQRPLPAGEFYKRRALKIYLPFWIALLGFLVLDATVLQRTYPPHYIERSLFGFFPRADMPSDVNSVFWYITWILLYYLLFPLVFMRERVLSSAALLFAVGHVLAVWNPPAIRAVSHLYVLHTAAFPLGMCVAAALYEPSDRVNRLAIAVRSGLTRLRGLRYYAVLLVLAGIVAYCSYHSGVGEGPLKQQGMSLITMLALVLLFAVKRFESRALALVGAYSYEIYLLHWPLVSRYNVFYERMPAALATLAYLAAFIAIGWLIQRATAPVAAWLDGRR